MLSVNQTINLEHTASSSMSSSSGTCGGQKKLKKLSHSSVLVIGLVFFEPFLGFFFRIFCVTFFPGYHSISVLEYTWCVRLIMDAHAVIIYNETWEPYTWKQQLIGKEIPTRLLSPKLGHPHQPYDGILLVQSSWRKGLYQRKTQAWNP